MEKSERPLKVQEILVCGGLGQNRVFLQSQANVVSLPVYTSSENDPVLIGSAMLAAAASFDQRYPSLKEAIMEMASNAQTILPSLDLNKYHSRKYMVHLEMLKHQLIYRNIMSSST